MNSVSQRPLISLIVPVYNVERYVSKCLESIKQQTYPNIEIIVIIDGATDDSCRIVYETSRGDGRFVIHEQTNCGVGIARNVGISLAHGEFIAFVDPDDWIAPDYVETIFNAQSDRGADIVICGYRKVSVRRNRIWRIHAVSPKETICNGAESTRRKYLDLLHAGLIAAPWGKLYKTEIIRKHHILFPDFHRMQDMVFNYRYYNFISTIHTISYIGYNYRIEYEKRLCRMNAQNSRILVLIYGEIQMFLNEWGIDRDGCIETYLLGFIIAEVEKNRICHISQEELLNNQEIQKIVYASRPKSITKKMFRFFFLRKKVYWLNLMTDLKIKIKRNSIKNYSITAQKHNNIKRIIHRCVEELKATYEIAKIINWYAALITFRSKLDIQIMNRNGFKEPESVKRRLMKKHQIMLDFLENQFHDFWESYQIPEMPEAKEQWKGKIWICWWQGLDNAPEIVKACVASLKRNAGKHEIIIITDANYKYYVQFPEWLEEKRKRGIISRTIYSDLLRMNLLATYGGIWIDSTFFCTGPCFEEYMQQPLWSIKRPDYMHCSVASGYFANYSLGCSYENRWVFGVIRDYLYNYWMHYDKLIDYLLTDYAIVLAQKHIKRIADVFANIQPNNTYCDELQKLLGQPYDEGIWRHICKDTMLYKLTWKQSFPKKKNGKETFFGKLINGIESVELFL